MAGATNRTAAGDSAGDVAGDLAGELAGRLARLIIMLRRDTAGAGASRVQLTVLSAIAHGGPRRITELAELEQVTQPSMTVLISRLERLGWVSRGPHHTDRRGVVVALTDSGRSQLAHGTAVRAAALARRLASLPADEVAALTAALPAIDAVLAADPAADPAVSKEVYSA